jgi:glyoxylase-like metal-dependent hydrolase (beta-lactamase superfamily II)
LPDYAPIPQSAFGPALNEQGYYVGRVERNLYWVTDGVNGVTNQVTHFVYSHHHADHGSAASLFDGDVTRIGHEETKRLLLRDEDPARPLPTPPSPASTPLR